MEDGEERRRRRRYSRSELEALRYDNVAGGEQRRRWAEVYWGLPAEIATGYDSLAPLNPRQRRSSRPNDEAPSWRNKNAVPGESGGDDGASVCAEELVSDGCADDESSGDEYDVRRPAFFIKGEPDFESGPPQDGLEYLRRVRWEAAQIPKVKVAKLNLAKVSNEQTPYMPDIPDIPKCPPHLSPSKHWEEAFLADFSKIREAFSEMENSCDHLPLPISGGVAGENPGKKPDFKQRLEVRPFLSYVSRMSSVSRVSALQSLISVLKDLESLSRADCEWAYALCVAVDEPLHSETCASLRFLLRKCMELLALKSEADDEVAMLNILGTIAGKYFGQAED